MFTLVRDQPACNSISEQTIPHVRTSGVFSRLGCGGVCNQTSFNDNFLLSPIRHDSIHSDIHSYIDSGKDTTDESDPENTLCTGRNIGVTIGGCCSPSNITSNSTRYITQDSVHINSPLLPSTRLNHPVINGSSSSTKDLIQSISEDSRLSLCSASGNISRCNTYDNSKSNHLEETSCITRNHHQQQITPDDQHNTRLHDQWRGSNLSTVPFPLTPSSLTPLGGMFESTCLSCGDIRGPLTTPSPPTTTAATSQLISCGTPLCQRSFCTRCIAYADSKGVALISPKTRLCAVCDYQSIKRPSFTVHQWHCTFADHDDLEFTRRLRDSLPPVPGLFLEIHAMRQACWRRRIGGIRKHYSFKQHGGFFEGRLQAIHVSSCSPVLSTSPQRFLMSVIPSGFQLLGHSPKMMSQNTRNSNLITSNIRENDCSPSTSCDFHSSSSVSQDNVSRFLSSSINTSIDSLGGNIGYQTSSELSHPQCQRVSLNSSDVTTSLGILKTLALQQIKLGIQQHNTTDSIKIADVQQEQKHHHSLCFNSNDMCSITELPRKRKPDTDSESSVHTTPKKRSSISDTYRASELDSLLDLHSLSWEGLRPLNTPDENSNCLKSNELCDTKDQLNLSLNSHGNTILFHSTDKLSLSPTPKVLTDDNTTTTNMIPVLSSSGKTTVSTTALEPKQSLLYHDDMKQFSCDSPPYDIRDNKQSSDHCDITPTDDEIDAKLISNNTLSENHNSLHLLSSSLSIVTHENKSYPYLKNPTIIGNQNVSQSQELLSLSSSKSTTCCNDSSSSCSSPIITHSTTDLVHHLGTDPSDYIVPLQNQLPFEEYTKNFNDSSLLKLSKTIKPRSRNGGGHLMMEDNSSKKMISSSFIKEDLQSSIYLSERLPTEFLYNSFFEMLMKYDIVSMWNIEHHNDSTAITIRAAQQVAIQDLIKESHQGTTRVINTLRDSRIHHVLNEEPRCAICCEYLSKRTSEVFTCQVECCTRLFCTKCIHERFETCGYSYFNVQTGRCVVCDYREDQLHCQSTMSSQPTLNNASDWHTHFNYHQNQCFLTEFSNSLPRIPYVWFDIRSIEWRVGRSAFPANVYGGLFEARWSAVQSAVRDFLRRLSIDSLSSL